MSALPTFAASSNESPRLSVGVDWLLRGVLASETGADLLLASTSEPIPGLQSSIKRFEHQIDEAGLGIELAESDVIVAGLLRAGLLARRKIVAAFEVRGLRQAVDALEDACSINISPRSGGVIVACHSRWTPPPPDVQNKSPGAGWEAPRSARQSDPRELACFLGIPILIPSNPREVAPYLNEAMRISRAAALPAMLYLSPAIMGGGETPLDEPDPALRPVYAAGESAAESAGRPMHIEARRRSIDRVLNTPLPGETVSLGLITVGSAHASMRHALHELGLVGRIPTLKVALANTVDPRSIEHILTRCHHVIIVEGGHPIVENEVRAIAQNLQGRHPVVARLWGKRHLPSPNFSEPAPGLPPDIELHPSVLIDYMGQLLIESQSDSIAHKAHACLESLRARTASLPSMTIRSAHRAAFTPSLVHRVLHQSLRGIREELSWPTAQRPVLDLRIETLDETSFEHKQGTRSIILFPRRRMPTIGRAAIVHAIQRNHDTTFIVTTDHAANPSGLDADDIDRLTRSIIGDRNSRHVMVVRANPGEISEMRDSLLSAILSPGVAVVILDPPRVKPAAINNPPSTMTPSEEFVGDFQETVFLPASQSTMLADAWLLRHGWQFIDSLDGFTAPRIETTHLDDQTRTPLSGWIGFEEFRITRKPAPQSLRDEPHEIQPPLNARHRNQTIWRTHLCGQHVNRVQNLAHVLATAGRAMGYRVQFLHGRLPNAAYVNLVFTRAQAGHPPQPITAHIPRGTADLVIALDFESLAAAIDAEGAFQVASPGITSLVLDHSPPEEWTASHAGRQAHVVVPGELNAVIPPRDRIILRAGELARRSLRTGYESGAILLGAALQNGFIPLTLQAVNSAVLTRKSVTQPRWLASIEFGRALAAGLAQRDAESPRAPARPESIIRRHTAIMKRSPNPARKKKAALFARLAMGSLDVITGLRRQDPDRSAERRFVARLIDCELWGSLSLAHLYAQLITDIYTAERSTTNYPITRTAIDEVARAILIPDVAFAATTLRRRDRIRTTARALGIDRVNGESYRHRVRGPIDTPILRSVAGEYWSLGASALWMLTLLKPARKLPWWHRTQRDHRQWVIQLASRCARDLPHSASLWIEIFRQLGRVRDRGPHGTVQMRHVRSAVQSLLELAQPDSATPH